MSGHRQRQNSYTNDNFDGGIDSKDVHRSLVIQMSKSQSENDIKKTCQENLSENAMQCWKTMTRTKNKNKKILIGFGCLVALMFGAVW